ncbi:hypothetical protein V8E36_007694 [Tilletia maclaganii]
MRPPSRTASAAHSVGSALARRAYAQPAATPPNPGQQQWKPPAPALATASTLTLFSADPAALIFALRSTLIGLFNVTNRSSNASSNTSHGDDSKVLLYALSKSFPSYYLQTALDLLNGAPGSGTEYPATDPASSPLTRIGTLSSTIPLGLLPQHVLGTSNTLTDPDLPLHSVALSLLPGSHAIPFRSHLAGRAKIQVGRWPHQKERWRQSLDPSRSRGADLELAKADEGAGRAEVKSRIQALGEGEHHPTSWKELWGKENARAELPESIAQVHSTSHLTTILFSDPAPHGLLEGLDAHFPQSPLLGLIAPPTPFETNGKHDQTLLFSPSLDSDSSSSSSQGAVGVVLYNPTTAAQKSERVARPALDRPFPDGLVPLSNKRHALTRARGNIISQLDGSNAAQVFLADLHARTKAREGESASTPLAEDSGDRTRQMAKGAKKEEEFYVGIYRSSAPVNGDLQDETPLLLAPLLSGAPSRGTLSLDTEADLGPGPGVFPETEGSGSSDPLGLSVAFFYRAESGSDSTPSASASSLSPVSIPGPDPSVWAMPRFLFLTLPPAWAEHASSVTAAAAAESEVDAKGPQGAGTSTATEDKQKKKPKVMALPNLFVAASERGWVGKDSASASPDDKSASSRASSAASSNSSSSISTVVPERLDRQTQWGNVPFGRALLNLRSRS